MPEHNNRVREVVRSFDRLNIDALLVTDETNVSYLTGFRGHDSALYITSDTRFFITDSRYFEEASREIKGYRIDLVKASTYENIADLVKRCGTKRLGFESMNLPFAVAERLKTMIGGARIVPVRDVVENVRSIKSRGEIDLIRRSISVTREVFRRSMAMVTADSTEQSIADRIEIEFIKREARPSFDLIVASGKNSSKPHARPSGKKIGKNSFVMVDMGCDLDGYQSDMTRMLIQGRVPERFKRIYSIVKDAQEKAIDRIRPGVKISAIDNTARGYIAEMGFGKHFGHALGHGIGMSVHEQPTISFRNTGTLKPGMVFTVEPAIYIPGFGGVRIEDMVLVTDRSVEILTR